jgi:hypothetical protein
VSTFVPDGIGQAPEVRARLPYRLDGYHLAFHLTAPGEVTISGTNNGEDLAVFELGLLAAGFYDYRLDEVFPEVPPGRMRIRVTANSPLGDASSGIVLVPERR